MSVRPAIACSSPFQVRGAELISAHRLRAMLATAPTPPITKGSLDTSNWCHYTSVASSLCMLLSVGVQPNTDTLRAVGTMYTLWSPVLHSSFGGQLRQQPLAVAAFMLAQGAALQLSLGDDSTTTKPCWPLSVALLLATAHLVRQCPCIRPLAIASATLTCVMCLLPLLFESTLAWRMHASAAPPLACLYGLTVMQLQTKAVVESSAV